MGTTLPAGTAHAAPRFEEAPGPENLLPGTGMIMTRASRWLIIGGMMPMIMPIMIAAAFSVLLMLLLPMIGDRSGLTGTPPRANTED
jgi:hypothetical protein